MSNTYRAVEYREHGDSSVLELGQREAPEPGRGQVRLAVRAAGVNPFDWKVRRGLFGPSMPAEFPAVPGSDVAGVVDAVGPEVTEFAVGDEVLGAASGSYAEVTLASPKGGQPPIDPKSDDPDNQTDTMERFKKDATTQKVLANSVRLVDVKADDYDTIFYAGGHGPMWDLTNDKKSISLIEDFYNAGKPVAAVCHGPCVLLKATYEGQPLVKGKRVTSFTNDEEEAVGLTKVMPFLVEDELKRLGGHFEKVENWAVLTITDGRLITGQNPASSGPTARALLKLLQA